MRADAAVACEGLTRSFGDEVAVADLDLEVPPGSIFGLLGPSGSGKTTTVRLLTGLLAPTAGEVLVLGTAPVGASRHHRRRLGYLSQRPALLPHLSVRANLRYVAGLYGVQDREQRIDELLELMQLGGQDRKRVSDASGGMQRRVGLAAALLHDPDLLFLDEPTAALDPLLRATLWSHFRRLRDDGRTLFVTTHYVTEATWCDQVAILMEGRLLAQGTPQELQRRAMGGDVVRVRTAAPVAGEDLVAVESVPGVRQAATAEDARSLRIVVDDASQRLPAVLAALARTGVASVDVAAPAFDEVFAALVASQLEHRGGVTEGSLDAGGEG